MSEAPHRHEVRIYYEDTDFSGVVYHANYLRFFERGRTEYLRELGLSQADLRSEGGQTLAFAVCQMTIDFHKPARMDDEITVETTCSDIRGASLVLDQRILRREDVLVTAAVKVALVGEGRARRLPASLKAALLSETYP